jgi:hypothetical protein
MSHQCVVGRSQTTSNTLSAWEWSELKTWAHVNLSDVTGGVQIASDPHGYVVGPYQHVVARAANGDLIEFFKDPAESWVAVNLSHRTGGARVVDNPAGYAY